MIATLLAAHDIPSRFYEELVVPLPSKTVKINWFHLAAHRILAEHMRVDGMPSLMLIVADDEHPYVLLNTID